MKSTDGMLADKWRPWLSLWLTIHLFVLIVCLSANRSASQLQRRLVRMMAPHSVVLHQDYGALPLAMTYGDPSDQPHQIQIHRRDEPSDQWIDVASPSTLRALDLRWSNFQRMLAVAASEKNEEIVHLCFDQALRQSTAALDDQVDSIRLTRQPVLSLATTRQINAGELPDTDLKPQTLYECRIIRLPGERVKLIPVLEKTRRSTSLLGSRGADEDQK